MVITALGDALLRPVEPAWNVRDDCVDSHHASEDLLVTAVAGPGEGVEEPDTATEAIFLGLVLVPVAVLVLVAAAVLLGAAGFLNLLMGEAAPGGVRRGLALFAVVDAQSIEQVVRVEALAWRAILPWATVVAVRVLWVTLPVVGVCDEL
jgi:hypothetical protein